MTPQDLKRLRGELGFTQEELGRRLRTTRMTITRYEGGTRRIPGVVEVAVKQMAVTPRLPLAGTVAAGQPIEPIPQTEVVEVPGSMLRTGDNFALRVKGDSMKDEGILTGDIVVIHRQTTARNGQSVVALVNGEATIKTYYRKENRIELHPANEALPPIIVKASDDFRIEGVVVGVIRHVR